MNFKKLDEYLQIKPYVTVDYPFDEVTRVYRVGEKMFALTSEKEPRNHAINLKCDPIYALELRSLYEGIVGGYHMSKKHWNTVTFQGSDVDDETVEELINHSYDLVYKSLTKKKKVMLEKL